MYQKAAIGYHKKDPIDLRIWYPCLHQQKHLYSESPLSLIQSKFPLLETRSWGHHQPLNAWEIDLYCTLVSALELFECYNSGHHGIPCRDINNSPNFCLHTFVTHGKGLNPLEECNNPDDNILLYYSLLAFWRLSLLSPTDINNIEDL